MGVDDLPGSSRRGSKASEAYCLETLKLDMQSKRHEIFVSRSRISLHPRVQVR